MKKKGEKKCNNHLLERQLITASITQNYICVVTYWQQKIKERTLLAILCSFDTNSSGELKKNTCDEDPFILISVYATKKTVPLLYHTQLSCHQSCTWWKNTLFLGKGMNGWIWSSLWTRCWIYPCKIRHHIQTRNNNNLCVMRKYLLFMALHNHNVIPM